MLLQLSIYLIIYVYIRYRLVDIETSVILTIHSFSFKIFSIEYTRKSSIKIMQAFSKRAVKGTAKCELKNFKLQRIQYFIILVFMICFTHFLLIFFFYSINDSKFRIPISYYKDYITVHELLYSPELFPKTHKVSNNLKTNVSILEN